MSVQQVLSFLLIVGVVGGFLPGSLAGELWTSSEELCLERVDEVESLLEVRELAREMEETPGLGSKPTTELINNCLNSFDGVGDVRALNELVEGIRATHSVCGSDIIEELVQFNKRINGKQSRSVQQNRDHGLLKFTAFLYGQIILTCKQNLEEKLEEAEQSDEAVKQSLDTVENDQIISKLIEVDPSEVDLPEDIVIASDLLSKSGAKSHSLDSQEMAEQFVNVKRSCQLIDSYAQNSIHPIMRLFFYGFRAGDDDDVTDNKLRTSPIVSQWLKAVQYCQGLKALNCSPSSAVPESLSNEVLSDELNKELEPKKFETSDKIWCISEKLDCGFQPERAQREK